MTHEELLRLTRERQGKTGFPFIAVVKYSRQPVPIEYGMETRKQAEEFTDAKEMFNPYVRWTEVKESIFKQKLRRLLTRKEKHD